MIRGTVHLASHALLVDTLCDDYSTLFMLLLACCQDFRVLYKQSLLNRRVLMEKFTWIFFCLRCFYNWSPSSFLPPASTSFAQRRDRLVSPNWRWPETAKATCGVCGPPRSGGGVEDDGFEGRGLVYMILYSLRLSTAFTSR